MDEERFHFQRHLPSIDSTQRNPAPMTPRSRRVTAAELLARFSPRTRRETQPGRATPQKHPDVVDIADVEEDEEVITLQPQTDQKAEQYRGCERRASEKPSSVVATAKALRRNSGPSTSVSLPSVYNTRSRIPQAIPNSSQYSTTPTLKLRSRSTVLRARSQRTFREVSTRPARPAPSSIMLQDVAALSIPSPSPKQKELNFFATHRKRFEPLLPDCNIIAHETGLLAQAIPFTELTCQPKGLVAQLKPYQVHGMSFLVWLYNNGTSGILGDEMGLGKTVQTLALLQYLKETRTEGMINLIICPLSVLNTWISEARRFTPYLRLFRLHGPVKQRELQKNDLRSRNNDVDIVVTTYETFKAEQSFLRRSFKWLFTILDEGHRIKNEKAAISKSIQGLHTNHMVILTGTPMQNNLSELWSLLHLLFPSLFTASTEGVFKQAFDLAKGQVDTTIIDHCRTLLELIMLRRMKDSPGVNLGLPPKNEVLLFLPLTEFQRRWYKRLLTRLDLSVFDEVFSPGHVTTTPSLANTCSADVGTEALRSNRKDAPPESMENRGRSWKALLNVFMQLRKVCNHPFLIQEAWEEASDDSNEATYRDTMSTVSSKFLLLELIIREVVLRRHQKILVFSEFTRVLDCGEELLHTMSGDGALFKYLRLDGSTPRARRNLNVRLFQDSASPYKVFLITTKAGGLGLTLTAACDVVILDHDWNPQNTLQAEARAHRIGQTSPVTVYKLCTQGTIEEQMLGRIQKKLYLSLKVAQGSKNIHPDGLTGISSMVEEQQEHPVENLSSGELQRMLLRGTKALSREPVDISGLRDMEFSTMIKTCSAQLDGDDPTSCPRSLVSDEGEEQRWLQEVERVRCDKFEGKIHKRVKTTDRENGVLSINRADRRIGKETTVIQDGWVISKQSAGCADWEAVPTLAGKDPRLAEWKRPKAAQFEHQQDCHSCGKRGPLMKCTTCPRSYHASCVDVTTKKRGLAFQCPSHRCYDCGKATSDCGGLILRCSGAGCSKAYCELCLDWDLTTLVGDSLPEFDQPGFADTTTYWIICPGCKTAQDSQATPTVPSTPASATPCFSYASSSCNESGRNSNFASSPTTPTAAHSTQLRGSLKRTFKDFLLGNGMQDAAEQRLEKAVVILE